ncbi:MAG: isocitrate lyase/phosphoenolpyruvate mutase family protein [Alphaproteobacteria bacterium]|jgi:2-methylisocitrate lyase-like PEP mutase family enzyme|nr:isocitrate lyase/phosphoenolpyruvate mutase family protein [Alphaproteobacteria bacterium]MDP6566143.1 isocitrate lyase/phosphoenolpyruvate mutase family protein [Alphaproteobacteria bacterium]
MDGDQLKKAEEFQALHRRGEAFVIPNPWDIGTARILAALGFEALATTSAGVAFSLGRRDNEGAVDRDEALSHIRPLVTATPLPISADLEDGYGAAPETVAETIRLAAATGIVGGSIEDATGDRQAPIYAFDHALERIEAAVEAARSLDFPFTLTARAENFLHGRPDLDDTIERLRAFAAAGADALYAPGLTDLEQIRTLCDAVDKPVNVVAGLGEFRLSVAELSQAGVRRISLGSALSRAALGAFISAAREIKDHGTFDFAASAASFRDISVFMQRTEK